MGRVITLAAITIWILFASEFVQGFSLAALGYRRAYIMFNYSGFTKIEIIAVSTILLSIQYGIIGVLGASIFKYSTDTNWVLYLLLLAFPIWYHFTTPAEAINAFAIENKAPYSLFIVPSFFAPLLSAFCSYKIAKNEKNVESKE